MRNFANLVRRTTSLAVPSLMVLNATKLRALCTTAPDPFTDLTLYQFKTCPFCCRVKAFLDYADISYETIEVNPIRKTELKDKVFNNIKRVPLIKMQNEVTAESSAIIHKLRSLSPENPVFDDIFTEDTEEWMTWSEKKLAVLLYPNITRNFSESWEAFRYASEVPTWSAIDRYSNRLLGPVAMYFVNGKVKAKHGIVDERAELVALLNEWTDALNGNKFLHGDKVTMPDLMVYGVVKAIHGLQTFKFVMQNEVFKTWYNNVDSVVRQRKSKI